MSILKFVESEYGTLALVEGLHGGLYIVIAENPRGLLVIDLDSPQATLAFSSPSAQLSVLSPSVGLNVSSPSITLIVEAL